MRPCVRLVKIQSPIPIQLLHPEHVPAPAPVTPSPTLPRALAWSLLHRLPSRDLHFTACPRVISTSPRDLAWSPALSLYPGPATRKDTLKIRIPQTSLHPVFPSDHLLHHPHPPHTSYVHPRPLPPLKCPWQPYSLTQKFLPHYPYSYRELSVFRGSM